MMDLQKLLALNRQEITFIYFINHLISDKVVVSLMITERPKGRELCGDRIYVLKDKTQLAH